MTNYTSAYSSYPTHFPTRTTDAAKTDIKTNPIIKIASSEGLRNLSRPSRPANMLRLITISTLITFISLLISFFTLLQVFASNRIDHIVPAQINSDKIILGNKQSEINNPTIPANVSVVVEKGDSLWSIAQEYSSKKGTTRSYVNKIMKYNGLSLSTLHEGQLLYLP
jgi:LysM repeat protein